MSRLLDRLGRPRRVAPLFAAWPGRLHVEAFGHAAGTLIALVRRELTRATSGGHRRPPLQGLGNVTWIIDINRQSLDRVIREKIHKLMKFFADSGWHVVEAKYGHQLQEAFARPGGEHLRRHIDDMSNEEYQSLFAFRGAGLRERFLAGADPEVAASVAGVADDDLAPLVQNLGGHDLQVLADAYRACDAEATRPSVVFAYTVKGWGLPIAGDPLNHAALLSPAQIEALRAEVGLTADTEWDGFPAGSPEARLCQSGGGTPSHRPVPPGPACPSRSRPERSRARRSRPRRRSGGCSGPRQPSGGRGRLVTTSPDVSVSTNLGGWINKMGVFSPEAQHDFLGTERLLRWRQEPAGHHIELGISEMNLFSLPRWASLTSCTASTCCRSAPSTTRSSAAASTP
jgi:pyruvate dehydrogenase E1 component